MSMPTWRQGRVTGRCYLCSLGKALVETGRVTGRCYLCSLCKALVETGESDQEMLFVFCRQGPGGDMGKLPGDREILFDVICVL